MGSGDVMNKGGKGKGVVKNISHISDQNCWLGDGTTIRDEAQRRGWAAVVGRRW